MKIKALVLSCLAGVIILPLFYNHNGSQSNAEDKVIKPGLSIGTIRVRDIFQNSQRGATYQKQIMEERQGILAELDRIDKEIQADKAGLNTLKESSSDRLNLAREILEKEASLQAKKDYYKLKIELNDQIWTKKFYQDIVRITAEIAKSKGLDLVLRDDEIKFDELNTNELSIAMSTQKFLYSGGCVDITGEVMDQLDKKAK